MPITKSVSGEIVYTARVDKFRSDIYGVHSSEEFQVADYTDQLKQLSFDLASMASSSRVKFKLQNPTPDSDITITFPSSDTTLGPSDGTGFSIFQCDSGTSPTASLTDTTLTLTSANTKLSIAGNATTDTVTFTINEGNITHNNLSGLTTGDPHTQYALLAGRSGGQTMYGGTAASNGLVLQSTSNATQGNVDISYGGTVALRVTSAGKVLIGDVANAFTGTNSGMGFRAVGSNKYFILESTNGTRWLVNPDSGQLQINRAADDIVGIGIDTAGQAQCGNTSGSYQLNVSGTDVSTTVTSPTSSRSPHIGIYTRSNTASNFCSILFANQANSVDSGIAGIHDGHTSTSASQLSFWTRNSSGTKAEAFRINGDGVLKNMKSANESTGAGTALLGTNSPAVTVSAPYTWLKVLTSDGSTGYIPVWK